MPVWAILLIVIPVVLIVVLITILIRATSKMYGVDDDD
jgi:hypothetical protein